MAQLSNGARQLLGSASPGPPSQPPACDIPSEQNENTIVLGFASRDGTNILKPKLLQRIFVIEQSLMAWLRDRDVCSKQRAAECGGTCRPPDSLLNYVFPTVETATTGARVLRFGGSAEFDVGTANAGLRCGPAITQSELSGVINWVHGTNRTGFFGRAAGAAPVMLDVPIPYATYLRTWLPVDVSRLRQLYLREELLDFMAVLERMRDNPDVHVYSDVVEQFWRLPTQQLRRYVLHDAALLGVALLLVLAYMTFYFRNVLFAMAAIMQIIVSLPIMFFVVDVVLQQRPVSAFACTALWVVTGVSADNIFVVHETWRAARLLRVNGELAPRERRLRWTLAQSARPLFIADGTTAFSLLINCLSPVDGVFQFGLCGGLLICSNFVLVLCYMPALLSLEEDGAFRWCECCPWSEASHHFQHRRLHTIHGILYRWRRPLVFVGIVLTLALVPSAAGLVSMREGHSFEIFAGLSLPTSTVFADGST